MKTWTELREKIESKFPKFEDELCITSNKEAINEISLLIGRNFQAHLSAYITTAMEKKIEVQDIFLGSHCSVLKRSYMS